MTNRVTRQQMIEQSCTDWAKAQIYDVRGYDSAHVQFVEEFDYTMRGALERTTVAMGFNFDDVGRQAELGSTLRVREHTIEYVVLGTSLTWARNLSGSLKSGLETELAIPLKDISLAEAPVIDSLEVMGVNNDRQIVPNAQPWQRFVYIVTLHVQDLYYSALV